MDSKSLPLASRMVKNDKKTQVALSSPILRTMQNMYYFENV